MTGVTSGFSGGACAVRFANSGSTNWTVPTGVTSADVLLVGGGGGGGATQGGHGGNGGSGVVIVRYLGSQRASGGTVTSSGGYTYHTFTSSGTFTA